MLSSSVEDYYYCGDIFLSIITAKSKWANNIYVHKYI
jgi:hypothetical protein